MSTVPSAPPRASPPTSRPLGPAAGAGPGPARAGGGGGGRGDGNNKSLKEKLVSFFAADSFGGLTRGAWATIVAAAAAVAAGALYDRYKKQEDAAYGVGFEKERKLTSSKDDWKRGKTEMKEGAKDLRSAASKWAKGE